MLDRSCILPFRTSTVTGTFPNQVLTVDMTYQYILMDEAIFAEAKAFRPALAVLIDGYRYVPTVADMAKPGWIGGWSGGTPVSVYFRIPGTAAQQFARVKAAMPQRYVDDGKL